MIDGPCHGCGERVVGCHASCERYKEFSAACKKERKSRLTVCLERTGETRRHLRWLDYERRKKQGG